MRNYKMRAKKLSVINHGVTKCFKVRSLIDSQYILVRKNSFSHLEKMQLLQVILLRLSRMYVLTRSCKTAVLVRSNKRTLQDTARLTKMIVWQDRG